MDVLLDFLKFIEKPRPRSLEELLGRVLSKSRELTGAEAGAIYTVGRRRGQRRLEAADIQFGPRRHRLERLVLPLDYSSIAGYVALSGETVRESDVYRIARDRPYRFNPAGDQASGYQSRSMMCFPLMNFDGETIAVVELVNRRLAAGGRIAPFSREAARTVPLYNRVIGGAVERAMMVERIERQNRKLRARSSLLVEQRARVAELQQQTEEAFRLSVGLLARAAELYDDETAAHLVRVNEYSYYLARRLDMPTAYCDEIRYSAQLHDVGKMSVDAAVLKKTGPLTAADRAEMNRHPLYGYEILRQSDRLRMAAEIALNHHEKWDGSGYPRGLEGEAIPLSARIVQMGDVYDALRAARHYKIAVDHDRACEIILRGDERIDPTGHFDPRLLELFARHHRGFARIWRRFSD